MKQRAKKVADSGKGIKLGDRVPNAQPASGPYTMSGGIHLAAEAKKRDDMRKRVAKQRYEAITDAKSTPEKLKKQLQKNEETKNRIRREFAVARFNKERPDYESVDEIMQDYVPVNDELASAVRKQRIKEAYRRKRKK